jgi:organic radical activating enzyme
MPETIKRLRGIILTLTERCNLRCGYCYVPVEQGRTMTPEVAARAVDWFAANAAEDGTLGLSFFGGEPFLAAEQMRRVTAHLRARVPDHRRVRVVTPTNALAMSEARGLHAALIAPWTRLCLEVHEVREHQEHDPRNCSDRHARQCRNVVRRHPSAGAGGCSVHRLRG